MTHGVPGLMVMSMLPMTDDPVETRVITPEGDTSFQEYFVRDRAGGDVVAIEYVGAADARPAPGVTAAITEADLVVVCPSNPVSYTHLTLPTTPYV